MFSILDRYIGKNIFFAVLLVAISLTFLSALVKLIDTIRYLGRGQIDFVFLLEYVALKLPGFFVTFFPVAILIGGVVGLGLMARNSEIVILQSVGLSKINIGIACIKGILPLVLVVLLLSETIVPTLEKYSEDRYSEASSETGYSLTASGTWIKDGNSFIGITAIIDKTRLMHVVKYNFEGNKLVSYSDAREGDFSNNQWKMKNVTTQKYQGDRVVYSQKDEEIWDININMDRLEILSDVTSNLSTIKLIDYIKYLKQNNVDASRHTLSLYSKFMSPVVMFVMMLLALSTIFGPLRSMNMGTRILSGIALGFGYYVLNQIVAPFSLLYGIPPVIGASFSTLIFFALAIYLLNRKV